MSTLWATILLRIAKFIEILSLGVVSPNFILVLPRRLKTIADEILKHNISVSILGPAGSRMIATKWETMVNTP